MRRDRDLAHAGSTRKLAPLGLHIWPDIAAGVVLCDLESRPIRDFCGVWAVHAVVAAWILDALDCGGKVNGLVDQQRSVAVLFARKNSIYKSMMECDVYDIDRDARTWQGGSPVVAHPPCRAWGALSHMSNPRPDEKDLARFAVAQIRIYGGVLEHPKNSKLWADQNLPRPGKFDEFGGWTLPIFQSTFGHKAEKATFLYIVGCAPKNIPDMPMFLGYPTHVIANSTMRQNRGHPAFRPEVTKAEREHTPPELAKWLVELAGRCRMEDKP